MTEIPNLWKQLTEYRGFGDGRGDTPQMDGPILRYEAEIVSNGIGSIK